MVFTFFYNFHILQGESYFRLKPSNPILIKLNLLHLMSIEKSFFIISGSVSFNSENPKRHTVRMSVDLLFGGDSMVFRPTGPFDMHSVPLHVPNLRLARPKRTTRSSSSEGLHGPLLHRDRSRGFRPPGRGSSSLPAIAARKTERKRERAGSANERCRAHHGPTAYSSAGTV